MSEIMDMEARIKDYVSANVDKINSKIASMGNYAKESTEKSTKGFDALGLSVNKLVTAATAMVIFRKVENYLKDATTAAVDQMQADAKLEAVIKATGGAAGHTTKELQKMAGDLQLVTTYGDEAIESMMSVLLGFQNIKGDNFRRATEAILDMSSVMGIDLVSSAQAIGKALDSPTQGMSSLSRQGFVWTEQEKEMVQKLEESGQLFEAQAIILKSIESAFGGVSRAMAETDVGKIEQTNNILGDMSEKLGNDLLPLMREWKELQMSIANIAIPVGSAILKGINAEIQMLKGSSRDLLQTNETIKTAQSKDYDESVNILSTHIEKLKAKFNEQVAIVENTQKRIDSMPGGAGVLSKMLSKENLAKSEQKLAEYEELIFKSQTALNKILGITSTKTGITAGGVPTQEATEEQLQARIEQLQEQIQCEEELKREIEDIEKTMVYKPEDILYGINGNISAITEPEKESLRQRQELDKQYHDTKLELRQAEISQIKDQYDQELELLKLKQEEELTEYEKGSSARHMVEQRHRIEQDNLDKQQQSKRLERDRQTAIARANNEQYVADMTIGMFSNVARATKAGSAVQKTLDVAQATANTYIGVTKALASGQEWKIPWLLGYGLSQVAVISSQKYADSGIVPGKMTTGDRQVAMVNSREMILNLNDQAALFDMIKRPNVSNNNAVNLNITVGNGSYDMSAARYTVDQLVPIIGDALLRAKSEGRLRSYESAR